ncbi:L-rhamnose mutarotase [Amycolatopsis rhabdoformis]|uniref:L-rhamnose mutarotase n=1 Tax=Amycolatopsis rhabdoformis TaxID=1448059 RepID=A0ABZ1I7D5_9PSEU|nr:L-rhamnose mutarotase [Amycolatopsis rhabdoformis]WSE30285.1 L-rhamnose mutarotase [Amycolatopsis rhabdoformis]
MTHGPTPQSVALRTRLKPGQEAAYESVHAVIPPELDTALRRAGVRTWRIWRSGLDLFHFVEVDDFDAMKAALADDPADIEWQIRINELLDTADDRNSTSAGLGLVWELPVKE